MAKNILIVVTSACELSPGGTPTGFWYEELATPYWIFIDEGYNVDIASPEGGSPPYDSRSVKGEGNDAPSVQRFLKDEGALHKIQHTLPLDTITFSAYDAIFFAGGHGAMIDL